MEIFLIAKLGVYEQGIYGVFDQFEVAKKQCKTFAKTDEDSYHNWYIVKIPINTHAKTSTEIRRHPVFGTAVFSTNKYKETEKKEK